MTRRATTRSVLCLVPTILALYCPAQAPATVHLRHRAFTSWGYNRAQYSVSNIHFNGPGYDFILHDVAAADEPKQTG